MGDMLEVTSVPQVESLITASRQKRWLDPPLESFWRLDPLQRQEVLFRSILDTHTWHYERNRAYRNTVTARGVGVQANPDDLARLLRPTAQTFKSYIDVLGTPFPQDHPERFIYWLADQLSIELPLDRQYSFKGHYSSLEALLSTIEHVYSDYSLEFSTSSGTSGRSTIMVRDRLGTDRTVESFYLSFQRYLGMQADHRAVFIMPRQTRIAMVRMASFSVLRVWDKPDRFHFTIPFPASPDQVRVRSGRIFRPGWSGMVERKLMYPFMNWMNDHYVNGLAVRRTLELAQLAADNGEKLLLFGGWSHLHTASLALAQQGRILHLPPGSLIGSGGGMKERYPYNPAQIRQDLARNFILSTGDPVPVRDVYGMAEGNWAAMQCAQGNYHLPPWVYAITLDQDNQLQKGAANTGLLAFFDPFGGGSLFPAFFRTADRVHLINGSEYDPKLDCACGDAGAYIQDESIQRADLLDEAGCAAQI